MIKFTVTKANGDIVIVLWAKTIKQGKQRVLDYLRKVEPDWVYSL